MFANQNKNMSSMQALILLYAMYINPTEYISTDELNIVLVFNKMYKLWPCSAADIYSKTESI